MRKCISFSHYNINISVSHDVSTVPVHIIKFLKLASVHGSLVMNIRCGLEILLA